jgi:hypothetical protein
MRWKPVRILAVVGGAAGGWAFGTYVGCFSS